MSDFAKDTNVPDKNVGDTISRQAAITTLCERRCGNKPKGCPSGFCTESLAVDCIPSADPEPRWIPVAEQLPEQNMTYRFDEDDMAEIPTGIVKSRFVLVTVLCEESGEPEYFVDEGFLKDGVWFYFDGYGDHEFPFPVTAWMSLPDPWKGEGE